MCRVSCLTRRPLETAGFAASGRQRSERQSVVKYAAVGPVAIHLPERVETNDQLQAEFPQWDMGLIYEKTGISSRHIAAPDECASDLGVKAAQKLFERYSIDPSSIDFLLFCTQSPDYLFADDRLPDPGAIAAADVGRGSGRQSWLFGFRLRTGPRRRADPHGVGAAGAVDYCRNVHEVHPPGRPQFAYDFWRWRCGDSAGSGRPPQFARVLLRHGWPWCGHPPDDQRRGSCPAASPYAATSTAVG